MHIKSSRGLSIGYTFFQVLEFLNIQHKMNATLDPFFYGLGEKEGHDGIPLPENISAVNDFQGRNRCFLW